MLLKERAAVGTPLGTSSSKSMLPWDLLITSTALSSTQPSKVHAILWKGTLSKFCQGSKCNAHRACVRRGQMPT